MMKFIFVLSFFAANLSFAATKVIPVGKANTYKMGLSPDLRENLKQELGDSCANIAQLLNEQTNFQAKAKSKIIEYSDISVEASNYTSATTALCEITYVDQSQIE